MANIPISQIWDVSDKDFASQIYRNFNNVSLVLSMKESGYYSVLESPTGKTIFPEYKGGKQPFRKYFEVDALPGAPGTLQIAHGLTAVPAAPLFTKMVRIYGQANKMTAAVKCIPIPHASATAADIVEIYVDETNINIVVGKDMSAYSAEVCFEYLID